MLVSICPLLDHNIFSVVATNSTGSGEAGIVMITMSIPSDNKSDDYLLHIRMIAQHTCTDNVLKGNIMEDVLIK